MGDVAQPTQEEQTWHDATQRFKPEQSLDRTQTLANFVFANVAVVGTLLAGLGVVADKGAALRSAPKVGDYPLPVLLVGLSLAAASVAMWPKLTRLNLNRVDDVRGWYEGQIRRRGLAVVVALSALTAAIIVATLSFTSPALADARISTAVNGAGVEATLEVGIEVTGASDRALSVTTIDGRKASKSVRLFNATTRADASGGIKVDASLDGIGKYERLVAVSTVKEGKKRLVQKRVVVPVL